MQSLQCAIGASSLQLLTHSRITAFPLAVFTVGAFKGIVHFEVDFWYVLAYLKGIQDVGVFFFHSIFNFDIFRSNRSCLSMEVYGEKSMHREVQIKHDLMTRKCKYTLMA